MSTTEMKKLFDRQQKIVYELLNIERMLKGSYCSVYTKCGKASCWCADGVGHKHSRLSWREAGKSRIRSIPSEDIDWVKQMTKNYSKFKKLIEDLSKIQDQIKVQLNHQAEKVIISTTKEKLYLKI